MNQVLNYIWEHAMNVTALIIAFGFPAYQIRERRKVRLEEKRAALEAQKAMAEKTKTEKQEAWGDRIESSLNSLTSSMKNQADTQNVMNLNFREQLTEIKSSVDKLDDKLDKEISKVYVHIDSRIDSMQSRNKI